MKVLFTGKGTSGSWKIRGQQVSEGLLDSGVAASAIPHASVEQMRAFDVIVLVKRPTDQLLAAIRESGKPFAWDVVDSWPQPIGNEWGETYAKVWLHESIQHVGPDLLICSTRAMMEDANFPQSCVIYHHARSEFHRMRRVNIDAHFLVYDGGHHYLGSYEGTLYQAAKHGLTFLNGNLFDFATCSRAAVCLRDCSGYAPRHWKSNVKLANAQALGIPALCSKESGYKETSTGGVLWIESPEDLPAAFDQLADPACYAELCAGVDAPPTLESVSLQYAAALRTLM
jgi:hypothetical protein